MLGVGVLVYAAGLTYVRASKERKNRYVFELLALPDYLFRKKQITDCSISTNYTMSYFE